MPTHNPATTGRCHALSVLLNLNRCCHMLNDADSKILAVVVNKKISEVYRFAYFFDEMISVKPMRFPKPHKSFALKDTAA